MSEMMCGGANFKNMKLYYFNPNNYGAEYFVCSESKEMAFKSLLNFLRKKVDDDIKNNFIADYDIRKLDMFLSCSSKELPVEYTLEEYEPNTVIHTEIS